METSFIAMQALILFQVPGDKDITKRYFVLL